MRKERSVGVVIFTVIWSIWNERNDMVFSDKASRWSELKEIILVRVWFWVKDLFCEFNRVSNVGGDEAFLWSAEKYSLSGFDREPTLDASQFSMRGVVSPLIFSKSSLSGSSLAIQH
ncbi:hypothetical protein AKJ16_DCAP17661 [Drosera capensis]